MRGRMLKGKDNEKNNHRQSYWAGTHARLRQ